MRKPDVKFIRITRWTFFVPLVIYISLLYIKYNKNLKLKSSNKIDEDLEIQRLLTELETATIKTIDKGVNFDSLPKITNIESEKTSNPKLLLESIFFKVDHNKNQELDIQELAKWIYMKITEHLESAPQNNIILFTQIDNNPRNGDISWDEYHAYFLRSHGLSENYINFHNKKHSDLPKSLKESIMRDRARWTETARNDPERLTLDEFLAFTHPESSHRALLQMVEDLFEKFDRDGDEQLTEDEFADLPSDGLGLDLQEEKLSTVKGSDGRRQEFRFLIDRNKDGKADRTELLMYIDPRNPHHAIREAQHLIEVADINQNNKLSLSEILSKADLFLESKMVDTEKSFHDEFR
ncbi:45 kDa calcium-binding protein isoform X2 [Chelonus insularis]|uniref:45 kDa calcium-binding protein isoform X2 n=1 Tax=Chelonus insularis TaxID=460826 RepID=UPI00158E4010|nr:45 kDa calcium-binding protein isoform X2 [Chelonus insularis]